MFLRNCWYVAGLSSQLPAGAVLGRRIVGDPIVLFRSASGALGALEDRCSHRGMPLAAGGECDGEILRCPTTASNSPGPAPARACPGKTTFRRAPRFAATRS